MRTVILHYHFFKNAGTSVDRILRENFGDRWHTEEFPRTNIGNKDLVEAWICSKPKGVAFSSHTASGPIPEIEGVRVVPIIFVRNPIERIISAYRFERHQAIDTWETQLARSTDLAGYVKSRLARPNDVQCRNFHARRLSMFSSRAGSQFDQAIEGLTELDRHGLVGIVERFDESMERLKRKLQPVLPEFNVFPVLENARREERKIDFDDDLKALLEESNAEDFALYAFAQRLFDNA